MKIDGGLGKEEAASGVLKGCKGGALLVYYLQISVLVKRRKIVGVGTNYTAM